MEETRLQQSITQLRRILDVLHSAIQNASEAGDIRRDVHLTLRACRIRRQLIEAQGQMFR